MKTILELTPRGDTLYSMPDEVYDALNLLLTNSELRPVGRSGRSKSLPVAEAVKMLPQEFQAHVKSEPSKRPTLPKAEHSPVIYYDEMS